MGGCEGEFAVGQDAMGAVGRAEGILDLPQQLFHFGRADMPAHTFQIIEIVTVDFQAGIPRLPLAQGVEAKRHQFWLGKCDGGLHFSARLVAWPVRAAAAWSPVSTL